MQLYGFGPSRSTRAAWALEEAGARWTYRRLDVKSAQHQSPQYLAINPAGKVPALVDGDVVLTESLAIVHYIGERFAESRLVPADLATRAQYLRWCAFAVSELEQPLWSMAKHRFALPKEYRLEQMQRVAEFEFQRAVSVLAQGLADQRPFICGEQFTGADIMLGHTLAWALVTGVALENAPIEAYRNRIVNRDALARGRQKEVDASPEPWD